MADESSGSGPGPPDGGENIEFKSFDSVSFMNSDVINDNADNEHRDMDQSELSANDFDPDFPTPAQSSFHTYALLSREHRRRDSGTSSASEGLHSPLRQRRRTEKDATGGEGCGSTGKVGGGDTGEGSHPGAGDHAKSTNSQDKEATIAEPNLWDASLPSPPAFQINHPETETSNHAPATFLDDPYNPNLPFSLNTLSPLFSSEGPDPFASQQLKDQGSADSSSLIALTSTSGNSSNPFIQQNQNDSITNLDDTRYRDVSDVIISTQPSDQLSSSMPPLESLEDDQAPAYISTMEEIMVSIQTKNGDKPFCNPVALNKAYNSFMFKNYMIGTFKIPGNGSSLIFKMKVNDAIKKIIFRKSGFQFGEHLVIGKKLDNLDDNINYVRVGTAFSRNTTMEDIQSDIEIDNNSIIESIEWLPASNEHAPRYLRIKVIGDAPKSVRILRGQYPCYPHIMPYLRCNLCLDVGHSRISCKKTLARCYICSEFHSPLCKEDQLIADQNQNSIKPKCFQCGGGHKPTSPMCQKNKYVFELHRELVKNGKPLREINKILRNLKPGEWKKKTMPQNNNNENFATQIKQNAQTKTNVQYNKKTPQQDQNRFLKNLFSVLGEANIDQASPGSPPLSNTPFRQALLSSKTSLKDRKNQTNLTNLPNPQSSTQTDPHPQPQRQPQSRTKRPRTRENSSTYPVPDPQSHPETHPPQTNQTSQPNRNPFLYSQAHLQPSNNPNPNQLNQPTQPNQPNQSNQPNHPNQPNHSNYPNHPNNPSTVLQEILQTILDPRKPPTMISLLMEALIMAAKGATLLQIIVAILERLVACLGQEATL